MGKPVVHFEVTAKDAGRAQEFYSSLFSWNIDSNNPMKYGLVNTGLKKGINGGIGQVDGNSRPYTTFYVEVENPQSYLDRAVSLGGRVIVPATEIPNMVTFAQFADPEGIVVGLVKTMQTKPPKPASRKKTRKRRTRRG
jgi:predicted enzyme related to lactoylglutathione lyase